jgi:hypothetical protein
MRCLAVKMDAHCATSDESVKREAWGSSAVKRAYLVLICDAPILLPAHVTARSSGAHPCRR